MAALPATATSPPRARVAAVRPARASLAGRSIDGVVAIASGVAGLVLANGYPIMPWLVVGLFVAWTAFAAWRFSFALPTLIALVPVVGLATWTGWLTFEEVDLLVLASAAGGYAARALRALHDEGAARQRPRLSVFAFALLALFLASSVISLQRGVTAAGGWHFGFFDGYDDALNSLRIFKSFALALLMTPLVIAEARRDGGLDRIGLGFTIALGLGALAVLQERLAFTGLLEFSDDYRVTGLFWEMHVGGAALDGFLALTIPFAVREAMRNVNPTRFATALGVLALAAYACLVTFSRGVYVAIPISMLVLAALVARQRFRLDRRALWALIGKALASTMLLVVASFIVFRRGGYRADIALFMLLIGTLASEDAMRRARPATWTGAALTAMAAAAIGYLVALVLPKGPYLVLVAALIVTIAAVVSHERRPTRTTTFTVISGWLWLAASAVQVAGFWGGASARDDSLVVVGLLIVMTFAASHLRHPLWPTRPHQRLATIGFAALVLGSVAVFTAGAYMGGRFSSSREDFGVRTNHWTQGLGRLHGSDWLLGKGLGRFPATSIFEAFDGTAPGRYGVVHRGGETFMTLIGPHMRYLGFDEVFRVAQRVSLQPHTLYNLVIRARATQQTDVHIEVCEKQLLYHGECRFDGLPMPKADGSWVDIVYRFDSGEIGAPHAFGKRPVFFAMAVGTPARVLDIQSVRMIGSDGVDVIANGDFADHTARWFTQSDKYHLPWHIKNIVFDVLFDQGALGLALFTLIVGGAWLRTAFGRARHHPDAPYVAAAIAGYLVVGAFDSLLDVPRGALLFWLVVIIGLALRNPRVAKVAAPVAPVVSSSTVPSSTIADEAAARARRRQLAFGERRRGPISGQ